MNSNPESRSVFEVAADLSSDTLRGLPEAEAVRRSAIHGRNELPADLGISVWKILLSQFASVLVLVLLVAIALSVAVGHVAEAAVIGAIACFSVLLGFIQEYRAERSLESLRQMASPDATVVRSGRLRDIPSHAVVPGDLLVLAAGDIVPADGRVTEAADLRVDESLLTGESSPVEKHVEALPTETRSLGDRKNLVYAGTSITQGRGRALVTDIGGETQVGRIGSLLRNVQTPATPLEQNLRRVGRLLAVGAGVVVLLVVGLGLLQHRPILDMLVFGIALAVAVVPEALPAVVTISLALGARRMARRRALIRRLPTVEALGSVTVICSDKTGTLTTGEMTVREIWCAGQLVRVGGAFTRDVNAPILTLLESAALCTDAELEEPGPDGRRNVRGDPTEGALIVLADKAGLQKRELERRWPRTGEIPFTSERKRMTTVHEGEHQRFAISKGALEVILASCTDFRDRDGKAPLKEEDRTVLQSAERDMGSRALRVLAVSRRAADGSGFSEQDMTFLGLLGIQDPPRPEAKHAVATCAGAGIRPVMITGDHPGTARAIARELGILRTEDGLLSGIQLDRLSDEDLAERIRAVDVFARVSPSHKLRIVEALQKSGEIPAMTGDGVNDAPALKRAAVGVAMGITGTDVAKGAASVILTDDNFASIVAAVEEGRAIFDNIQKYLMYLLSSNTGEISLMAAAIALGLPLPLTAVQILYVNLATDGLPALALAMDPHAPDLMHRLPRKAGIGLLTRSVVFLVLTGGIWSALLNIALFAWALRSGRPLQEAMTMVFVSLVMIQFFKAYAFRSVRTSIVVAPFANRWLNVAILWETALLVLILHIPSLSRAVGVLPLSPADWAIVLGAAVTIIPILEMAKAAQRRGGIDGGPVI